MSFCLQLGHVQLQVGCAVQFGSFSGPGPVPSVHLPLRTTAEEDFHGVQHAEPVLNTL